MMKVWLRNHIGLVAWSVSGVTTLLAVVAWGQTIAWQFENLSIYTFFPLLGLVAFSLMWSHYVTYAARIFSSAGFSPVKSYLKFTSIIVLVCLLLHPGLLAWQLFRDGLGLPPGSYRQLVGGALFSFILLGIISWVIFLLFELRRKFVEKGWWKIVVAANHVAMILIIIHGFRLGGTLAGGWFRTVWWVYTIGLIAIYGYLYWRNKLV